MQKIFIVTPLLLSSFSAISDEALTLAPVTVTATRSPTDSKLVSSTLISRTDIERRQLKSVEEALRGVAGINIANSGGVGKQTSVFMRGTASKHVLVLIDGVRIGSATLGTSPWQHLPISEIESIEVIRGPKSSLYGADAIGGIIHIHTRNAQTETTAFKPTFSVGGGTYGHTKVQGGLSGKHNNTWYNLNISHEQTEGFNSYANNKLDFMGNVESEPDLDGYENHSGSVRVGHAFDEWLTVQGYLMYSTGDTEYDGSFQNQTDYTELSYGGEASIKAADFWRIDLSGGESRDESNNFHDDIYSSTFDTQRVSFAAINHFTLHPKHLLSLGYDFQNDSIDTSDTYTEDSRNNHAVFIQYQGEWRNNTINLAFREDFNQQFGANETWNAGWGYQFDAGISVSASYGTAFKAPTFNDLYSPFGGNTALSPEQSETYEVGIKGEHQQWHWALNGYLTYIDNLIAWAPAPTDNDPFRWAPSNINQARIMGLEAIIGGQVYGFDLLANYSALKPQSMDSANFGKVLPRRAQQVFRLDIDRKLGDASMGTSINYEGRRFDDAFNSTRVAGFATWDLRAEYQFFEQLTAQASVKNVLNNHYQTAAGYNSAGTTFFFNLRYTPKI